MLHELVRTAAAQAPGRAAVISPHGELTYSDCADRFMRAAGGLRQRGIERFGCLFQSPADALVALCASTAVGCEACLYPPDPGPGGYLRLATRFRHQAVVTDEPELFEHLSALTLAQLQGAARARLGSAERFPVLILTTGTTGEQKGARHDWARLLRGVRQRDLSPGTRWLLAYNVNQFAGVQVLLHTLANSGTLVEPASRRPEDAIDSIREHEVTHASATPTFWRLLAGRLDRKTAAALPLTQITLGGEAASEGLLRRLRTLFPLAQISHVYAGTEVGSVVSVRDGKSGLPASLLQRGDESDVQFRIVDGELQVRSLIGMLGYYHGVDDDGSWRPTGDLVEVRDGRIHFVGRTTEIINVGGAKIHPLPVEERICALDGVELAAVYGRPNAVTGQIVAADVVPSPEVDVSQLEQRIRDACQELPAAARPRRIRFVGQLRVHGNKLVRREA